MNHLESKGGWLCLTSEHEAACLHTPESYARKGSEVVRYRNRVVYRLEEEDGNVLYAKWLYPQNEGFLKTFAAFFKRIFRGPRVQRIFRIHQELAEAGFGCAEPVLAAWRKNSLTELFVCKEIKAKPVYRILREASEKETLNMLSLLAADLRRLHKAGFVHGDAIPGNICLDSESGKIFYLDNDRTQRMKNRRQALRNVIQFCSHLHFYCGIACAVRFFLNEYGKRDMDAKERDRLYAAIRRRIKTISSQRARRAGKK